jgi:hypothetical protein
MKIPLGLLRPGALLQCRYQIDVIHPETVTFSHLSVHLEHPPRLTTDARICSLTPGDVVLMFDGQKGCDGVIVLEGRITPGRKKVEEKVKIRWLSQSKKQETRTTGSPSGSTLYDPTIEADILPKMREVAKALKQNHGQVKKAFVVYDVVPNAAISTGRSRGSFCNS